MSQVNLIVKGKLFTVPRYLLEKSGYFKDLFEIQDDNIEINTISPEIFQIILLMLVDDNIGKELAHLLDYLRIDEQFDLIKQYYCGIDNCLQIMYNEKYCDKHRCTLCSDKRVKSTYCQHHVCKIPECDNQRPCKIHTCKPHVYIECDNTIYYNENGISQVCRDHKCILNNCLNVCEINTDYCKKHKCKFSNCDREKYIEYTKYDCCIEHKCQYKDCNEINPYPDMAYCSKHLCQSEIRYCLNGVSKKSRFCDRCICSVDSCKNERATDSYYCHTHND